jgi:hypothetical protein
MYRKWVSRLDQLATTDRQGASIGFAILGVLVNQINLKPEQGDALEFRVKVDGLTKNGIKEERNLP